MSSTIPQGFTLAQLDDKQWYPIEVKRYYSADYPEGYISLDTLSGFLQNEWVHDIHFTRRSEALAHCQQEAGQRQNQEIRKWENLTVKSNVYPDRCAHYIDLIIEVTGHRPLIHQFIYDDVPYDHIVVHIRPWRCSCGTWHTGEFTSDALRIEDALEEAANSVYASSQACQCSQGEQEQTQIAV